MYFFSTNQIQWNCHFAHAHIHIPNYFNLKKIHQMLVTLFWNPCNSQWRLSNCTLYIICLNTLSRKNICPLWHPICPPRGNELATALSFQIAVLHFCCSTSRPAKVTFPNAIGRGKGLGCHLWERNLKLTECDNVLRWRMQNSVKRQATLLWRWMRGFSEGVPGLILEGGKMKKKFRDE